MDIRKVTVSQINPAVYNPRIDLKPGDPDYEKLKKSINTFGYIDPIIWNQRTGNLVGGHQRLKILREQGFKEVEVSVVDLTLEQEKLLNLALNRLGEGSWDENKLATFLEDLQKIPDIDLSLGGFDLPEITQIIDKYTNPQIDDDFDADAAANSIIEPVAKRGDIVTIGRHVLMCGDATSSEDMHILLGNETVDLVDLDWPYNVDYMGGSCPRVDTRPRQTRKWDRIYADNLPQDEYEKFMRDVLVNIKTYLKHGGVFYQWQGHKQLVPLYRILAEMDFHVSCLVFWKKESAAISYADYSFQTEQAFYGFLKGQSHYFAGKPGESNWWEIKRDPTKSYSHPCQKPTSLAERAIKNSSKLNDRVLDVFMGAAGVGVAAEALGRRFCGMELDPKYFQVSVRRMIAAVGKENVSADIRKKYLEGAEK